MTEQHLPSDLHILLADDDQDDLYLFQEALGYLSLSPRVTVMNDGNQLMKYLKDTQDPLPQVLFLDLNMPLKSGFECLKELKLDDRLKTLPVIILTTSIDTDVVNQLYLDGAHYFICKPAGFEKLKRVILQAISTTAEQGPARPRRENFIITSN